MSRIPFFGNRQQHDDERTLLAPFLQAQESDFRAVKQAVMDSEIGAERAGQLLDWYSN